MTTRRSHFATMYEDQSLPALGVRWEYNSAPLDLSADLLVMEFIDRRGRLARTKTTGLVGSDGANGTPNLIVSWEDGELADPGPGSYLVRLTARTVADQLRVFRQARLPTFTVRPAAA